MDISIAEARNHLTHWIRVAENGEPVVITRNRKPVVQLGPIAKVRRVKLGAMKGRIQLWPGWNDPIILKF
jgi:prevent-host-death family protein